MDKSWMCLADRRLPEYEDGVKNFLDFAYYSKQGSDKIRCPCKKCNNVCLRSRDNVEADLLEYGILQSYITWMLHGEEIDDSSNEKLDSDPLDGNDEGDE
ncbi:Unknown protein [Striga hermonthica]|uniref:Transposase-associated domain-containing protein n=1 Tax=Striga hermonthica TaxID=68872 RepID=A0A9N7NJ70_STRHE|nr:Unknown protein [Striga hermonthica]